MLKMNLQLFAHKKGVGSTKNGRDSESKRLGAKRAAILFFGSYVICLILLKEEFVVDYIYKGYSALKTRR